MDPESDLHVLIHVGAEDALEIANKTKSDVDKGSDSDVVANALCDLVEDLIKRIPYIKVFVSLLTPRFDKSGELKLKNLIS